MKTQLPKLTGSPKQVEWANRIRDEFIAKSSNLTISGVLIYRLKPEEIAAALKETRADVWITHRTNLTAFAHLCFDIQEDK